jgi:hypothetical protein
MEETTLQEFTVMTASMTSHWLGEQMDLFYAEQVLEHHSGSTGEILEILSEPSLAAWPEQKACIATN